MDVSSVKAKATVDTNASSKPKSTAEQLISDFSAAVAERMKMSGQGMTERSKNGVLNKITAKSSVAQEPKNDPAADKAAPRDDHQPRERTETQDRNADERDRPVEAKDTAPRENQRSDDTHTDAANDDQGDDAPKQDAQASNDQKSNDDGPHETAQDGDDAQTAEAGDAADQSTAEATAGAQAETVIAAVTEVASPKTTTETTGVEQQAAKVVNKTETAKPGQQAAPDAADGGEDAPDLQLTGEGAQKKATAKGNAQQTQANLAQKTENNHVSAQDPSLKQQQAADMASKLGNDQKVEVKVNVTKQSEHLVSQPTANLGAQAATKTEGDTQTQTAAQTATKGPLQGQQMASTHNLGNQANQQGQDGQQQAQQNMQAAIAEAAKNTAATDSKSQASQSTVNAATAATAKAGGAEGMTNAQGVSQNHTTQQAQQTAAAQKPQHTPMAQQRAQVTEQVNVQIAKAIANGMDKINIQLKPAHLGRIDVSMEMSHDGKITAVVTADNKDTLNLLKQDSGELTKAMREAGLDLNSGDLSFNLREGSGGEGDTQSANAGASGSGPLTNEPPLDVLLDPSVARPNIISDDRIDITA